MELNRDPGIGNGRGSLYDNDDKREMEMRTKRRRAFSLISIYRMAPYRINTTRVLNFIMDQRLTVEESVLMMENAQKTIEHDPQYLFTIREKKRAYPFF